MALFSVVPQQTLTDTGITFGGYHEVAGNDANCMAFSIAPQDCRYGGVLQSLNWGDALLSAEANTLAGYTDWRMRNIKELSSIAELRCGNPASNLAVFPNTPNTEIWSSSPSAANGSTSWTVQFITGDSQSVYGRHELHAVRLVRSGS